MKKKMGAVSQADINKYSAQIYNQAVKGSPVNKGLPVTLANLVVAQARHETGNFSSNAFVKHKNAFGYSYVKNGTYQVDEPGLIADNGQPVANYAKVEDSVKEIVDWIYRRKKEGKFPADLSTIKTADQYAGLLKSAGYFQDTLQNYLTGLKNFFKVITPGQAAVSVGGLLVAGAVVAYMFRKQLFPGML